MSPVDQYDNVRGQSQIQITPNNVPPVPKLTIFLSALFPAGSTRASSVFASLVCQPVLFDLDRGATRQREWASEGMDGRGNETEEKGEEKSHLFN